MLGCAIALGLFVVLLAAVGVAGYHLYRDRPLASLPRMDGDHLVNDSFSWFNGTTSETLDLRDSGVPDSVEAWYRSRLRVLPGWTLTDDDAGGVEHAITFRLSGSHSGAGRIMFTGIGGTETQVLISYTSG
jgi:hypothetical protein